MAEIEQEIKALVSKIIKVPEDKLDVNANIFTEYGIDSLLGVEILAGLDKKYDLDISEDKLRHIKTVSDIVRITKELLAKKG
jgi:acyl carrier protein